MLTIRGRLGRGEVGSFSPRLPSAPSFRPLPGRKRLSLNYGRGARLNFAERTKGRFKLNARLFRLRQSSSFYLRRATPSSSLWSFSLLRRFLVQPLSFFSSISSLPLLSEAAAFRLASVPPSRLANLPAVFLTSYVRG